MESYLLFVLLSLLSAVILYRRRNRLPLPPGPKGWPIVGNWFELPINTPWVAYSDWAKEYGDIVRVRDFARDVIILNSWKVAYDLLEKRSNVYSGRPQYFVFHELLGLSQATISLSYGDTWRKHRKLYNQQMHKGAIKQFERLQHDAVRQLLGNILDLPLQLTDHVIHMSAGIVMGFAYGYKLQSKDDPYVKETGDNSEIFIRASLPGAFLVENLPILKYVPAWFPGANFKRIAAAAKARSELTRHATFRKVKDQMKTGNAPPSFVLRSLMELGKDDESDEYVDAIKSVAGGIFGAGTHTTARTILNFILAMAVYPECQKKAQAEITRVIGNSRLPEFEDRASLPYLDAMLKEVLRWFPIFPLALPHATTENDVYEGYHIPAGSVVIPNTWEILHDPASYVDPYTFRPERFIPHENGGISERDPTIGSFGYGRRICSGKNLAESTVWLAMATLLSVFDWTEPVDEMGKKIDRTRASHPVPGRTLCRPPEFTAKFTPRFADLENILNQSEKF